VGKQVTINGVPFSIVGVTPQDFFGTRERLQFWTELLQKLELDDKSQQNSKPSKSTNINFSMPSPAAWVSAYVAQSIPRIGVYLTFSKDQLATGYTRR